MDPNMSTDIAVFDLHQTLHDIKHYLPAQAPLKDFVHHNTLHAFQSYSFYDGLEKASAIFGYKVSLSLKEFRAHYGSGRIREEVLRRVITERKGASALDTWLQKAISQTYNEIAHPRVGVLRANWKTRYNLDMDALVHPLLFRTLCSYLDQGISIWDFPISDTSFLSSLREMEKNAYTSFFRNKRAHQLLLDEHCTVAQLLDLLVGDPAMYRCYLFDQQFGHQGWSGIVSAIEDHPEGLLENKQISMQDLIHFELLLEIDALDSHFGPNWRPLKTKVSEPITALFAPVIRTELNEVLIIWQEAFEWSYYDQVLAGIQLEELPDEPLSGTSFQALFCIDDRECSLRRYIEHADPRSATYGTPGFFGVEFYYQPEDSKFYIKSCPAPVTPKYLIKEKGSHKKRKQDLHFSKHAQSFHSGWLISQSLGFWSAFRLFLQVFRPTMSPATATSLQHMDKNASLTIEHEQEGGFENGLQIGYTVDEMVCRVDAVLHSIGLVQDFAPIVYVVGHGASSVNNPHYAAYDCGACSGRAGSVNARVFCHMANHPVVREKLAQKGLVIPPTTQFVGALHDTTRDDIVFFDEESLSVNNLQQHRRNEQVFEQALNQNAKERSRRFVSINTDRSPARIHELVRRRSVSLFEPRPELNHATNALCIVGDRVISKHLFLDRRSFLNSYDHQIDPQGQYLFNILKAAAPVCGGINLEYYFSRVDNQKLGAGTKLPHNVMGLFGVANGIDGDLRPGLPSQMIEVHDPVRLLIIVRHHPQVVLDTIKRSEETYEWFKNNWVWLVAVEPQTRALWLFRDGQFQTYQPLTDTLPMVDDPEALIESHQDNLPVFFLK